MQITELSKEIFRLKEALGALSPPLGITSSSSTHHGNPGQQVALQNRIAILSQQLQVRRALAPGMYEMRNKYDVFLQTLRDIFCDLFAGLGEKAQTGGDYIPLPFTGSCTGQFIVHNRDFAARYFPFE